MKSFPCLSESRQNQAWNRQLPGFPISDRLSEFDFGDLLTDYEIEEFLRFAIGNPIEALPKPEMSYGVSQTVSSARRLGSWRTASA